MNIRQIPLRFIRQDARTQARAGMNEEVIEDYAAKMADGQRFPPVVLFQDEDHYWLGDGFHRVAGAEKAGKKNISAEIHEGSFRDAWMHALGANDIHGLRLTNADKRHKVSSMLDDEICGAWSNQRIADVAKVSDQFVSNMKKERVPTVGTQGSEPAAPNRVLDAMEDLMDEDDRPSGPEPLNDPSKPQVPDRPESPAVPLKAGPDDRDARIAQLERLVAERDEEIEDLRERLADTGDLLKGSMEENESLHRILDAEDLLGAFKKEVKAHQELARVTQSRNNGLMNENADLTGRLKSALRKIERIEKKAKIPDLEEVPA
jgi:hypothetical protein